MKKTEPVQWPKSIEGNGRSYLAYEDGSIQVCDDLAEQMMFADREQLELDVLTSALVRACQRIANSVATRRREFWAAIEKDLPEVATEDQDWQFSTRTKRLRKAAPKEST